MGRRECCLDLTGMTLIVTVDGGSMDRRVCWSRGVPPAQLVFDNALRRPVSACPWCFNVY